MKSVFDSINKCQSCLTNKFEILEECDNIHFPYYLCSKCHDKLLKFELSSIEYYHLKSLHGHVYHLSDNFYDEFGIYFHNETPSVLQFPTLDLVCNNLNTLINHCIVTEDINEEVIKAFSIFDKQEILDLLDQRIQKNRSLAYFIYEIVASVLGVFAENWIIKEWINKDQNKYPIELFANCLSQCFHINKKGFELYIKELNLIDDEKVLSEKMRSLIYFRSENSLNWIEENIHKLKTISSSWGLVVAASHFTWDRAEKWIKNGRPLSLVALDAISNCFVSDTPLLFKKMNFKLEHPSTIEEMNVVLLDYLQKDDKPRVKNKVNIIINQWNNILK